VLLCGRERRLLELVDVGQIVAENVLGQRIVLMPRFFAAGSTSATVSTPG